MNLSENYGILARLYRIDHKINALSEVISTGKRVNKASDAPSAVIYNERLLAQMNHYTSSNKNIDKAEAAIRAVIGGIESAIAITKNIRDLSIAAQNSALTSSERWNLEDKFDDNIGAYYNLTDNFRFNTKNYLGTGEAHPNINVGIGHFMFFTARIDIGGGEGIDFGIESIEDEAEGAEMQDIAEYNLKLLSDIHAHFNDKLNQLTIYKDLNNVQYATIEKAYAAATDADTAKAKSELVKLQLLEENNLMLMQMHSTRRQSYLKLLNF